MSVFYSTLICQPAVMVFATASAPDIIKIAHHFTQKGAITC